MITTPTPPPAVVAEATVTAWLAWMKRYRRRVSPGTQAALYALARKGRPALAAEIQREAHYSHTVITEGLRRAGLFGLVLRSGQAPKPVLYWIRTPGSVIHPGRSIR